MDNVAPIFAGCWKMHVDLHWKFQQYWVWFYTHPVFAIEESLGSIFRSIPSLCLLCVNAVERTCNALWSSLLPFGVCSSCSLHSLQCPDDPRVFNQCHFSISHSFAESEEDNAACRMWKSLLGKDECEWAGRRSWRLAFVYFTSGAVRRYIPHRHWEFLSWGGEPSLNFLASANSEVPAKICCPL